MKKVNEKTVKSPFDTQRISYGFPQMEAGFIIAVIQMLRMYEYDVEVNGSLTETDFGSDVQIVIKNPTAEQQNDESQFTAAIVILTENFDLDNGFLDNGDYQIYIANIPNKINYFDYGNRRLLVNPTYI